MEKVAQNEKKIVVAEAMRVAYGDCLADLGAENDQVVVFDADLSKGTTTAKFGERYPERFFNMGISESHMVGAAAGFALDGYIPIVSTFAVFVPGRTYDQIRNTVCYSNLNVKFVATHGGLSVEEDGGSHQALEDLALTRVLPNMEVYSPADGYQTRAIIKHIVDRYGPIYVRLPRSKTLSVYEREPETYSMNADVLRDGEDVAIIATGVMVHEALEAADLLQKEDISCRVINVHCLKPLDRRCISKAAKEIGKIVTLEDHSIIGGLGSAVAECVTEFAPCSVYRIGTRDVFGQSGDIDSLLSHYRMDQQAIVEVIRKCVK